MALWVPACWPHSRACCLPGRTSLLASPIQRTQGGWGKCPSQRQLSANVPRNCGQGPPAPALAGSHLCSSQPGPPLPSGFQPQKVSQTVQQLARAKLGHGLAALLSPASPGAEGPPWEPPGSGARRGSACPGGTMRQHPGHGAGHPGLTVLQTTPRRRRGSCLFSKEVFFSLVSGTGQQSDSQGPKAGNAVILLGAVCPHSQGSAHPSVAAGPSAHTQLPGAGRRDSLGLCVRSLAAQSVVCQQPRCLLLHVSPSRAEFPAICPSTSAHTSLGAVPTAWLRACPTRRWTVPNGGEQSRCQRAAPRRRRLLGPQGGSRKPPSPHTRSGAAPTSRLWADFAPTPLNRAAQRPTGPCLGGRARD